MITYEQVYKGEIAKYCQFKKSTNFNKSYSCSKKRIKY